MKVPGSIRDLWDAEQPTYELLREKVDEYLLGRKEPRWHYESRVKGLESFALKVQTGRVKKPAKMEDFFACTLVVENRSAIPRAAAIVEEGFAVVYRRPKSDDHTHLAPEAFSFDDLRLYVKQRADSHTRPNPLFEDRVFEIQIKTFLQHAWSIATHDLVYKGADVSWSSQRVAFQVKAMLENAEASIASASSAAVKALYAKNNRDTTELARIIERVEDRWAQPIIPSDRRRMADTILDFARSTKLGVEGVFSLVDEATMAGRGASLLNLPPFYAIVDAWFRLRPKDASSYLRSEQHWRAIHLAIPREVELPRGVAPNQLKSGTLLT